MPFQPGLTAVAEARGTIILSSGMAESPLMQVNGAAMTRRSLLQSLAGFAGTTLLFASRPGRALGVAFPRGTAGADPNPAGEGAIEFESSDAGLAAGFAWAREQALAYVHNGDPVGPWYEAALPGRDAFCMRDTSHQSTGAQLLGMGARTRNMLHQFAAHISPSKKWCSWWEITGEGKPAPVDYKNDHDFWYDLPANFDVLDACYRQWLWSRDDAYVSDPVFLNYYRRTVTDYVAAWDRDHNGLLEHLPGDGHMGIATYDEDLQDQVRVGADLLAAQYAAYSDYAAIERARGASAGAAALTAKANSLKALYSNHWWDPATHSFYGALGEDGKFHANLKASIGASNIEFPLYFGLIEPGPRAQALLDRLEHRLAQDAAISTGQMGGVEGVSYLPNIFYQYGRSQAAYQVLLALIDPSLKRRAYPEVSFTVVGNIGEGLMGIRPLPRAATISTFSQLATHIDWAALHHVPVGPNRIAVRHTGNATTTLTNEAGPNLFWQAEFPGSAASLVVDGRRSTAESAVHSSGIAVTRVIVPVPAGETRTVRRATA